MDALSAHVVIIDPSKSLTILREINSIVENKFGISNITIQIETYPEPDRLSLIFHDTAGHI